MKERKHEPKPSRKPLNLATCKAAKHSGATYSKADGRAVAAREIVWFDEPRGLGLRLHTNGRKSWTLRYVYRGQSRFRDLGDFPAILPDVKPTKRDPDGGARQRAERAIGRLADGLDPFPRSAPGRTVASLEAEFFEFAEAGRTKRGSVKASTLVKYRESWRLVTDRLGAELVDEIDERKALAAFQHWKRAHGIFAAKGALRTLRHLLDVAVRIGARREDAKDPTRNIKAPADTKRGLALSDEQLAAIGRELAVEEEMRPEAADIVAALRLLALTGCRRREIAALEWSEVDFAGRCLRLADSKTGAKVVPLPTAAAEILAALPRLEKGGRVFPAGRHEVGFAVQYVWNRVRVRAGVPNARIHDLRHSYVTRGLAANISQALVGKTVGHLSTATTARYSHLSIEPTRAVAERISSEIAAGLAGKPLAEVVSIEKGRG